MQTQKLDVAGLPAKAAPRESIATTLDASRQTVRIEIFDTMAPLEAEWRMMERDTLASVHQSYAWCTAWVDTYRRPLAIVRGSIDGRPAFILPLEVVRANSVRSAQFIGARHSNINTGLFSSEFFKGPGNDLTMLEQAQIVRALRGRADLIVLGNVPLVWRGRASPLALIPAVENQNHAFQLPFLDSFEVTLKQVNAKRRRKKYRHQSRILDDKGGCDYRVATSPAEQSELLDLFFRQKAVRFKAAGLPDVFQDAETRSFLHRLLDLRGPGHSDAMLEMHALRLKGEFEGHIPAVAALSRKGDHVICQFASIDETLVSEASPGELLFWLMIERLHREGVALFDFGIGDQIYKRSWCPAETTQYDLILPVTALGHIASLAQRGVTRAKAAIKANPQIYGFVQRLRARQQAGDAPGDTADKD